jgi:RimJ/RimL family protein N-acetyltransferase
VRHDVRLEGDAYAIRPVTTMDAPFILELRTDPDRSRYLHPVEDSLGAQTAWIAAYLERPDDYYFVVERLRDSRPEGTVGLYNLDHVDRRAEWGRWVLRRDSLAAIESALLVYRLAFNHLGLEEVYCRTVAANRHVVNFHRFCGLASREEPPAEVLLGSRSHQLIEQFLTRTVWGQIEDGLRARAAGAARLMGG